MFKRGAGKVAEDISKTFTCDNFQVYGQTIWKRNITLPGSISRPAQRCAAARYRDLAMLRCRSVYDRGVSGGQELAKDYYRERGRRQGQTEEDDTGLPGYQRIGKPRKWNQVKHVVDPDASDYYVTRKLKDHDYVKDMTKAEIQSQMPELEMHTEPRLHQLQCFYLTTYYRNFLLYMNGCR